MVKLSNKGVWRVLWIMLISIVFTQGMWINVFAFQDVVSKKIYEDNKCLKIDANIPQIVEKYGDNISGEILKDANQEIDNIKSGLKKYQQMGYQCNNQYQFYETYKVFRSTKNLLSFYTEYYEYMGGAHGMTIRKSYNINKNNGKLINLEELFRNNYDYESKINNIIKADINKDKEKYFDNGVYFKGIDKETKFYLSEEDLVIYYGLYEIAPYASGIIEFKIPLTSLKDGLLYDKI